LEFCHVFGELGWGGQHHWILGVGISDDIHVEESGLILDTNYRFQKGYDGRSINIVHRTRYMLRLKGLH
jgi:hypothetical protein